MPMPESVYGAIKEAVGDKKVTIAGEEVTILEYISGKEGLYEKADAAKKIQDSNKDLISQREKWDEEKKTLKSDLLNMTTERDEVKKNQPSAEDIAKWEKLQKTGMTPDVEARMNAMEKERDDAVNENADLKIQIGAIRTEAQQATKNGAEKDLDNRLITALNDQNIKGAQADAAVLLIKNKGFVKIAPKEEGGFAEKYFTFSDGKTLESTFDKVVETFATQNEYLKTGTERGGSGNNHESTSRGTGADKSFADMLRM